MVKDENVAIDSRFASIFRIQGVAGESMGI